ncbi:MAG: DNA polymerase III subunit gamma/tau, partial [Thermodesulfobacteriota bacterium]
MSYLVLARKWRPQTFSDVVGQQAIVKTLRNGLLRGRVAHALLFSGVRGVGKTTLARIMAKALNCQEEKEKRPCNSCESCREISEGAAVDLNEIDGASNRGINEIRELKENIRFYPVKNRYKIIIIDEVHMLTGEAFNALLKTLEEPPGHVYFMFATTEIHKVPITILSRCQRYELKRVDFRELEDFFTGIARQEGVSISREALQMVVREADGSVRDGLSLLDQLFSFGDTEIGSEEVFQMLGLVDRGVVFKLAEHLLAGDLSRALSLFDSIYSSGLDLRHFASDLLECFRGLMVCSSSSDPEKILNLSDQDLAELKRLVRGRQPQTLYNCFQILMNGVETLRYSSQPRMEMEIVFVRITQSGQVVPASTLLARLNELAENFPQPGQDPVDLTEQAEKPAAVQNSFDAVSEVTQKKKVNEDEERKAGVYAGESQEQERQVTRGNVRKNWQEFIEYVKGRTPWMAEMIKLGSNPREAGNEVIVQFENHNDCHFLLKDEYRKSLTTYAQDFFQKELQFRVMVRGESESGREIEKDDNSGAERRALAADPLVTMTAGVFNGRVAAIRTGPRFRG